MKNINVKFDGNDELIGNAKVSINLNNKFLSVHSLNEGFESATSILGANLNLELVISLSLFNLIPIKRKTKIEIYDLEDSDYEIKIFYDTFSGKFSKKYDLKKINLSDQRSSKSNSSSEKDYQKITNSKNVSNGWKKYLFITGLIFIFFKACPGCFNSSDKKFEDKGYIGKYCEDGFSNKCIEFFEDGTFKSTNFIYGVDYLGNNTYFGDGEWSYIGEQDAQYSLFSDCYITGDYDEVDIKSFNECCKIKEEIAFFPASNFNDGRARFKRLITDRLTHQTIGCFDYIKVK